MRMPINKAIALFITFNIVLVSVSMIVLANSLTDKISSTKPQEGGGITQPEAIAIIAAAIAVVGSTIASGIALKSVATAGFAAYVERPDVKTWLLILGGLAEGIAIYGLLLAILILGKIG